MKNNSNAVKVVSVGSTVRVDGSVTTVLGFEVDGSIFDRSGARIVSVPVSALSTAKVDLANGRWCYVSQLTVVA